MDEETDKVLPTSKDVSMLMVYFLPLVRENEYDWFWDSEVSLHKVTDLMLGMRVPVEELMLGHLTSSMEADLKGLIMMNPRRSISRPDDPYTPAI